MKKLTAKKMVFWIIGLMILAIVIAESVIVGIDSYQYHQNQKLIERFHQTQEKSKTLVVFFSRSGNTEVMARQIAKIKNADVLPLKSDRNKIGFIGHIQALKDARNTTADIVPKQVDLSQYDTIYIGSPIWLYSPAPQIYEFAKHNDFKDKKVILFNSMNSKFEQSYIDNFAKIIHANGGKFEKHIYIIRGRMGQQMGQDEFLKEIEKRVE